MKTPPLSATVSPLLLAAGLIILAVEPVRWLVNSWFEQSYDSDGLWVFLLFCALSLWSVTSPRQGEAGRHARTAVLLLCATALVRLAGQLLAVNVIGALALVMDVYALGLLLGLQQRKRPLSPFWLALLFACALPLERVLQRTLGYALQQLSSWSSCALLSGIEEGVVCSGTRIRLPSETLLIDLPCSGASALVLLTVALAAAMAVARPGRFQSLLALLLLLLAAWLSNSLRIITLALGVMHPLPGVDVMRQPWHELVGLLALLPSFALLVLLFLLVHGRGGHHRGFAPLSVQRIPPRPGWLLPLSLAFVPLALLVVSATPRPVDAGRPLEPPYAPLYLGGEYGRAVPLLAKERAYFEQYGGAASKMQYGRRGLLITHTESPLRHLHGPDDCLRGLGFQVEYLGSHEAVLPTAVYRALSTDGAAWRVSVSFLAADGSTASSVAEAVWHWFHTPQPWYALQRIAPWDAGPEADRAWDRQLAAALDYSLGQLPGPTLPTSNKEHSI